MKRHLPLAILLAFWIGLYGCAGPSLPDFSALSRPETAPPTPAQTKVIQTARSLLGTPYRFGGTTPKGFDCSGFIGYVFLKGAGLSLPRTSDDLSESGRPVSVPDLRPADLVYFKIERQKPLHVGIYIGKGRFIHAPNSKGQVNIQRLDLDYWRNRYLGARRVL